jgi:hypothetical protein
MGDRHGKFITSTEKILCRLCPVGLSLVANLRPNPKKKWDYYGGVDCNLTLCPLQSRLQHIYHGHWQPYARVNLNLMPESTLRFGLW